MSVAAAASHLPDFRGPSSPVCRSTSCRPAPLLSSAGLGRRSKEETMSRGDKSKYSARQKRKAEHIEDSYESRGVGEKEAEARAWATVNKQSGGGENSGSGTRKSPRAKSAARRDSARRGTATKHGHSPNRGRASAAKRRGGAGAKPSAGARRRSGSKTASRSRR
jgi:hypothetical protein